MTSVPQWLAGVAFFALLVSVLTTCWVRRFALRTRMLDLPGKRRNHASPTPRGGGVGVLAGALLPLPLLYGHGAPVDRVVLGYIAGAMLLALAGWIDDRRGLSARIRLLVQMAAASVFVALLRGQFADAASPVALVGAWLLLVGLSNAWNFMDGINGIAASQTLLVAAALALLWYPQLPWAAMAVTLAVASAAFLPFNLPGARIFLGDVGSTTMGFMVAALLCLAVATGRLQWPMALVLVSAFGIDSALTLAQRILRGRRWWCAHREHTYQWLVRAGLPHWRVSALYALWTVASMALVAMAPAGALGLATAIAWLLLGGVCWTLSRTWVLRRVQRKPR